MPEAWIAPPATRELRGWVRHRAKLVWLRSNLKCQVHAVLAGVGVQVPRSDLFGPGGQKLLAATVTSAESISYTNSADVTRMRWSCWPGRLIRCLRRG